MDKSKVIFGNEISAKDYKKACKSKAKYIKKFGDDSDAIYNVVIEKNDRIGDALGVYDVLLKDGQSKEEFDRDKGIIVGNIRMGFGHYRISMAMASAAEAMFSVLIVNLTDWTKVFLFCFFFWSNHMTCRILVPQPGIKLTPSAVKM